MVHFVGHNEVMEETNIIRETLIEELDRNKRSLRAYEIEREKLPKGSVTVRARGNKTYCYLKYRDGERTVTQYVGPTTQVEEELRAQVARRRELESVIRRLKNESRFIEKALR
jgi:hypothetical protein